MRSELTYNHVTFLDLCNKHIPPTNISAASIIGDQLSLPTAICLKVDNFIKAAPLSSYKRSVHEAQSEDV